VGACGSRERVQAYRGRQEESSRGSM